jgi:hypothetical protein
MLWRSFKYEFSGNGKNKFCYVLELYVLIISEFPTSSEVSIYLAEILRIPKSTHFQIVTL